MRVLASLAVGQDVGAGAEVDVAVAQPGQLADPQSGGDGDLDQGVVASSGDGRSVGGIQECGDLGCGQVGDVGAALAPLGRDGQHPGDRPGVFGVLHGGVGEQGVHGGQAGVAGGDAVAALFLQVVQEPADQVGVELADVDGVRRGAGGGHDVTQEQPPGVAVGGDGVGAGADLSDQSGGEERLQGGCEPGHRDPARRAGPAGRDGAGWWWVSRSAAAASSSLVPVRYQ